MAIETLKESLCVNQVIGKAKENIIAEGDIIIPDIKPDILSTINTNGNICIYKKEVIDGKIKIDGGVQVYIMYLADDENSNVRGINTVINFSKVINMENVNSTMNLESEISLKDIECRILNGRKVNVKANIEALVSVYSNQNIEFIKGVENRDDIQVLNSSTVIDSLLGTGITKAYAKDTITINDSDNLAEVLKINLNITNKEIKTSYNKVLAKSDMQVNIVYLTEDNRVNEVKWQIPVMGFIDMQNVSEDNICNINYEIKNILIKPNSAQEHSIYVEIELEISCNAFEKKNLDIIEDLYSPTESLNSVQKKITVMKDKKTLKNNCIIKERMVIPEMQSGKICNVEVLPVVSKQNIYNDKIIYDGELKVKFLYISGTTNRLDLKVQNIPFNVSMDSQGVLSNSNLNTSVEVLSQDFVLNPDGNVDINVSLNIITDVSKMKEVRVIDNIEVDTNNENNIYSIVVYFVKPGDTLWNIAKKFKSTISAITLINGIDDENKINVGQQLFIPKFV